MNFEIPTCPPTYEIDYMLISIENSLSLTEAGFQELRRALGTDSTQEHVSLREQVTFGDQEAELRGWIGVHEAEETKKETEDELDFWMHYELLLRTGKPTREYRADRWDQVTDALADVLPAHSVDFHSYWAMPSGTVLFAVDLPIEVGEVSGFSEIRGVRLVEPDSGNPDEELYSLILDRSSNIAAGNLRASFESGFDPTIFAKAMDRTFAIGNLAMTPVGNEGDEGA